MPTTLILDLGNTLVPFSFAVLAPQLASHRDAAMAIATAAESGAISPVVLQAEMCRLADIPAAGFETWWNSIFDSRWLIPPVWVETWLQTYRVGLMSNTNASHFEFLANRWPLLRRFHFHVLSYEVGACKPDPRIFAAAEALAQCPPAEIFYLDDLAPYIEVARQRGWQAQVFTAAEALPTWLSRGPQKSLINVSIFPPVRHPN